MNKSHALAKLSPDEEAELEASMLRHPAGRKQSPLVCPTCDQRVSGALGDSAWVPELVR